MARATAQGFMKPKPEPSATWSQWDGLAWPGSWWLSLAWLTAWGQAEQITSKGQRDSVEKEVHLTVDYFAIVDETKEDKDFHSSVLDARRKMAKECWSLDI